MIKNFLFIFINIIFFLNFSPSFCSEQPLDLKVQKLFENVSSPNAIKFKINSLMKDKKGAEAKEIFTAIKNYFKGNDHRELVIDYIEDTFARNLNGAENNNEAYNAQQQNTQAPNKKQDTIFSNQEQDDDNVQSQDLIKQSLKELVYLIQDYNKHAKDLTNLFTKNKDDIKKEFIEKAELFIKNITQNQNNSKDNNPILCAEALYLMSSTNEEKKDNKQLASKTLLQIHPDKLSLNKNNESIKKTINDVSASITSLLQQNKPTNALEQFYTDINNINIPKPSSIKKQAIKIASTITFVIAQTIGYDLFADARPNTMPREILHHSCKNSMRGNLFALEDKLINLKYKN